MTASYFYVLSSLPMMHFGAHPPFGFKDLLSKCKGQIPEKDFDVLALCADEALFEHNARQETLRAWISFETGLRNELVKIRARRRKAEPDTYVRGKESSDIALYHIAMHSHRIPSLIESERFLDAARWQRLEELSQGHYFDLGALIVYALKLNILWRWEKIAWARAPEMIEGFLSFSDA